MWDYDEYLQIITTQQQKKDAIIGDLNALQAEINQKVEDYRKKITKSYESKFRYSRHQLIIENEKQERFAKRLNEYATFDTANINSLFAALVMFVEGERFVPLWQQFYGVDVLQYPYSCIIIREKALMNNSFINQASLERLIESGEAFKLCDGIKTEVQFFDEHGLPNYNFGAYKYLEEFLVYLIDYRIKMGNLDPEVVSWENLSSILINFIMTHQTLLLKNKTKREKMLYKAEDSKYPIDDVIMPLCRKMNDTFNLV